MYDLQDSDQTDEEHDPDEEDAEEVDEDASARRRGRSRRIAASSRRRMSILTSKYYDVPRPPPEFERDLDDGDDPCGVRSGGARKRRFFASGAEWDPVGRVVMERVRAGVGAGRFGYGYGAFGVGAGVVNGYEADPAWVSAADQDMRGEELDEEVEGDEDEDE